MKKISIIASVLAVTFAFGVPAAEAKGCVKGAAVGAVGGHFLHHHGLLGAAAGCAIGHHHAKVKARSS